MKELVQKTIDLLKERVKVNLEEIKRNQSVIRDLLKKNPVGTRNPEFDEIYNLNKTLLSENNDFINLQISLVNFLNKYKDSPVFMSGYDNINHDDDATDTDYFTLTIEGVMKYNEQHPHFHDDEFFRKLLQHYQALVKVRKI